MNCKVLASLLVVGCAFMSVQSAHASRKFADIYKECGLGAMLFSDDKTLAAITNVTSDLGTTAILSNASSPDTCKGRAGKSAMFIHESYDAIASDLSRGNGKYLDSLAALNGWSADQQVALTEKVRHDFAAVVASNNYSSKSQFDKSEALFNIVMKHSPVQS